MKFRIFDNAYEFYNVHTQQYLCAASVGSDPSHPTNEQVQLVGQNSFDPDKCWIQITPTSTQILEEWLQNLDLYDVQDFELYFSL